MLKHALASLVVVTSVVALAASSASAADTTTTAAPAVCDLSRAWIGRQLGHTPRRRWVFNPTQCNYTDNACDPNGANSCPIAPGVSFVAEDALSDSYKALKRKVQSKAVVYLSDAGRGGYYRYSKLKDVTLRPIRGVDASCVPASGNGSIDIAVQTEVNGHSWPLTQRRLRRFVVAVCNHF